MHENREISCTSWATDQDRSAKAINRTADMNAQEKSDCVVLPVNQPNNEGQQPSRAPPQSVRRACPPIQIETHRTCLTFAVPSAAGKGKLTFKFRSNELTLRTIRTVRVSQIQLSNTLTRFLIRNEGSTFWLSGLLYIETFLDSSDPLPS
jgi:hypothetical protein